MAQRIALFPLTSVLFPDMLLPLHVFEPRYRVLVRRSLDRDEPFGIALIKSGPEVGGGAEPHAIGTTAHIVGHQPLPDGRSFIVVRGGRRFRIDAVRADEEPYLVGDITYLDEDDGHEAADLAGLAADAYSEYLHAILAATDEPRSEVPDLEELREGTPRQVGYRVAAGLAIDHEERQRLLEAPTSVERLGGAIRLLDRENRLLKELLLRLRAHGEGPRLH